MNKPLTKKESEIADLFLDFLLTNETQYAFKSLVNSFFLKHKIQNERALFICKYLERKSLVSLILDSELNLRSLNYEKSKIQDFLKNDGINRIWIAENKLHNDSKLSELQLKTFWWIFGLGIFGGLYSGYDFIKNLTKPEDVKKEEITKEEMESELSKLRTLILTQKKDSVLINSNSEKK